MLDFTTLNYHLRAIHRRELWRPFREVAGARFQPSFFKDQRVVLAGPSLGYIFPLDIFKEARDVIALDHDPIVNLLFPGTIAKTAGALPVRMRKISLHTTKGLEELARYQDPNTVFVFCNVLGQLKYSWLANAKIESAMSEARDWFSQLSGMLHHQKWISFHDRISINESRALSVRATQGFSSRERLSEEKLFQKHVELMSVAEAPSPTEFESHWMDFWQSLQGPCYYAPWKITPQKVQWIEFYGSQNALTISP